MIRDWSTSRPESRNTTNPVVLCAYPVVYCHCKQPPQTKVVGCILCRQPRTEPLLNFLTTSVVLNVGCSCMPEVLQNCRTRSELVGSRNMVWVCRWVRFSDRGKPWSWQNGRVCDSVTSIGTDGEALRRWLALLASDHSAGLAT